MCNIFSCCIHLRMHQFIWLQGGQTGVNIALISFTQGIFLPNRDQLTIWLPYTQLIRPLHLTSVPPIVMHFYESKFDIIISFWTVLMKFISLSFIYLVSMYDYQDGKYHENLETKGSSSFQLYPRSSYWQFRPDEGYSCNNSGSLRWCHWDYSHLPFWMWALLPQIDIHHVLMKTWYLWSSFEIQPLRLDPNWAGKSLGALVHMPKSGLVCTMAILLRYLDQWWKQQSVCFYSIQNYCHFFSWYSAFNQNFRHIMLLHRHSLVQMANSLAHKVWPVVSPLVWLKPWWLWRHLSVSKPKCELLLILVPTFWFWSGS